MQQPIQHFPDPLNARPHSTGVTSSAPLFFVSPHRRPVTSLSTREVKNEGVQGNQFSLPFTLSSQNEIMNGFFIFYFLLCFRIARDANDCIFHKDSYERKKQIPSSKDIPSFGILFHTQAEN